MGNANSTAANRAEALHGRLRRDPWDWVLIAAIFTGIGVLAWAALATSMLQPLVDIAERRHWGQFWVRPTVIWVSMGLLLMLLRTVFWLRYRPWPAANPEDAPRLSVIIPAYNEGA